MVIGSDREADEKSHALREAGANVQRIADVAALSDQDVIDAFFVISTPQDEDLSARLRALADRHRFLLCCIDQPKFGFVAMAAIVKAGPVRIAISTAGLAPRVGKIIKDSLQRAFDKKFERFIECEATQKERNRKRFPDSSAKRREAMIDSASGFELDITVRYPTWFESSTSKCHLKPAPCHPEPVEGPPMPSVEIVAVGTELLLGQLIDTNTAHIAQTMAEIGIDVYASHAVGDNRERIAQTLRRALARADGVITSGGLGPTVDDLTKEAACDALGVDAVPSEDALRALEERYAAVVGRPMPENNRKQALMPRGAVMLKNPHGSAPGFVAFDAGGKFIAAMPGVPSEMKPMLANELVPWLRKAFAVDSSITTRTLHTLGIAESELDERIEDLFTTQANPKIAVLAHGGRCDVKMMAKTKTAQEATALIAPLEAEIRKRLNGFIFGADADTIGSVIVEGLARKNETVAFAESCTGGMIAAALTKVPGASKVFAGGIVAYENSVKIHQLGVQQSDLEKHGAVSAEVAGAMATGARQRLGSSIGVSVTGIAGPGGGSAEKPVGLVWIGIADKDGVSTSRVDFRGDRDTVRARATLKALGLLWKRVSALEPTGVSPT